MASESLKPYLTGSTALHGALAAAVLFIYSQAGAPKTSQVYTIDFVGPSAIITQQQAAPAAAPAELTAPAKAAPQTDFDEFGRRNKKHNPFVLPRPSLLRGWKETPAAAIPTATLRPAAQTIISQTGASSATPGDSGVAMDMPNFPYPWYISQVRASLWNQWSRRMPAGGGQCVVRFSLMRNGSVVDLRTEESSGDASFDLTALSAVQDGGPYPPLPKGFTEPFLKIHVTLKAL